MVNHAPAVQLPSKRPEEKSTNPAPPQAPHARAVSNEEPEARAARVEPESEAVVPLQEAERPRSRSRSRTGNQQSVVIRSEHQAQFEEEKRVASSHFRSQAAAGPGVEVYDQEDESSLHGGLSVDRKGPLSIEIPVDYPAELASNMEMVNEPELAEKPSTKESGQSSRKRETLSPPSEKRGKLRSRQKGSAPQSQKSSRGTKSSSPTRGS